MKLIYISSLVRDIVNRTEMQVVRDIKSSLTKTNAIIHTSIQKVDNF